MTIRFDTRRGCDRSLVVRLINLGLLAKQAYWNVHGRG
jgi:hypothetical protein